MRNSRFKAMSLSESAAARVKEIVAAADKPIVGVRVGVKNGGCAGMSYTMEFAEAVAANDEVVEDKGVKLLIEPKALLFQNSAARPANSPAILCPRPMPMRQR